MPRFPEHREDRAEIERTRIRSAVILHTCPSVAHLLREIARIEAGAGVLMLTEYDLNVLDVAQGIESIAQAAQAADMDIVLAPRRDERSWESIRQELEALGATVLVGK